MIFMEFVRVHKQEDGRFQIVDQLIRIIASFQLIQNIHSFLVLLDLVNNTLVVKPQCTSGGRRLILFKPNTNMPMQGGLQFILPGSIR